MTTMPARFDQTTALDILTVVYASGAKRLTRIEIAIELSHLYYYDPRYSSIMNMYRLMNKAVKLLQKAGVITVSGRDYITVR